MRLKTVNVSYDRKQNLGDFSSMQVSCSIWAEVDVLDDPDATMQALWAMVKENVRAQMIPVTSKGATRTSEYFLGLPVQAEDEVNPEYLDNESEE